MSVPLSKLSHILSGTSKWLKFGGGREGNNEGGEGEERMDPEGKEGGRGWLLCSLFAKGPHVCPRRRRRGHKSAGEEGWQNLKWGPKSTP